MPKLQAQQAPPPAYYADNVQALLAHVENHYGDLLPSSIQNFIGTHARLPTPAARLFARLVGRKGPVFRLDNINYAEVGETRVALACLEAAGLIQMNPPQAADRLLTLLRVSELRQWFTPPNNGGQRKAQLIDSIVLLHTDTALQTRLAARMGWFKLTCTGHMNLCLLLFFGNRSQDWATFVMQDLGLVRYEAYPLSADDRAFQDSEQLREHLRLRQLADLTHRFDDHPRGRALAEYLLLKLRPPVQRRLDRRPRDKGLLRLGAWFEANDQPLLALETFSHTNVHPARERRVRLLSKQGQYEAAQSLIDDIRATPSNAAERDFGVSFDVNKGRRARRQRPAICDVDVPSGGIIERVEEFALRQCTSGMGCGWHVENRLPKGLVGLCYWDVLFQPTPGAFHHPFQSAPLDLFWDDFVVPRRTDIARALASLRAHPQALKQHLHKIVESKQGTANALVSWQLFDHAFIDVLCAGIPADRLLALADFTLHNIGRFRNGFPDLFVIYAPGCYEFIEVKSPNDQLQAAQYSWLEELQHLGMPARVLRYRP